MRKLSLLLSLVLCFGVCSEIHADFLFFKSKKKKDAKKEVTVEKPAIKGPKPYGQVITNKAKTTKGLFKVHKVDNAYFFEIPDSILGRDLLVVNRISKSAADIRKGSSGYGGDQIGENIIRFEKGPNDKLFMKSVSYSERSKDSLGMYFSVIKSNVQPIVGAFDIKAYKKDTIRRTKNSVIEITDFANGDNSVWFFDERVKKNLSLGSILPDRSYIDTIRSYPTNIEVRTVKTYIQKSETPGSTASDPLTYELNTSIVILPKVLMKPRYYDPRVGYFTASYTDFDKNPQGVEQVSMISRWRLEPKDEDVEKYKRGELVEPKKPIVFYIDPTTPKKWVPYLIQGVNDWKKAFEKAGFKNAIYALEAPKDSTWSIDDARHSAIVYKSSNIANASGPHVHDPRTGEILETHINWYHNVMELIHDWYFVQTAAIDTAARKMEFSDELMGQLIRFVSSHEVGHTLGLRHNFGSSSTVPVEKLRDKAWVEANGHTPSIMDYARFNYVAQPEDHIGAAGIFPRIGIYDDWSIEWGYKWLPEFKTAQDEVPYLNKRVIEKLNSDKRFTFGTEIDPNDPRNQSEDLGDNAMKASTYGIKNMQCILPNLFEWTKEPNKDYSNTTRMYTQIVTQFGRYMLHVTKNVAGIYNTPKLVEQPGAVNEFASSATQKEALAFLDVQLFNTPSWLVNKDIIEKLDVNPVTSIGSIQRSVIQRLISKNTFDKMLQNEAFNGSSTFTPFQLLDNLKKSIWSELATGKNVDIYRRNLQKVYVDALINLVENTGQVSNVRTTSIPSVGVVNNRSTSDAAGIARVHLMTLKSEIAKASAISTGITKAHFVDLLAQITETLDPKK
jgi:hypothetical protein